MPKMSSNIPSSVFYGSILSEFLRIARCTLLFKDFSPKAVELFQRMIKQGGDKKLVVNQIKKAYHRHQEAFCKFNMSPNEMISEITAGQ